MLAFVRVQEMLQLLGSTVVFCYRPSTPQADFFCSAKLWLYQERSCLCCEEKPSEEEAAINDKEAPKLISTTSLLPASCSPGLCPENFWRDVKL